MLFIDIFDTMNKNHKNNKKVIIEPFPQGNNNFQLFDQ